MINKRTHVGLTKIENFQQILVSGILLSMVTVTGYMKRNLNSPGLMSGVRKEIFSPITVLMKAR